MGSGAARDLGSSADSNRVLDPDAASKLAAAMLKLDAADAEFKMNRDDTRQMQRVMAWTALAKVVDSYLREVGNVLYKAQQVSLDIGVEGAGQGTRPYIEETSRKFEKLSFRMQDGEIHAVVGSRSLGKSSLDDVSYEFCEKAAIDWLVFVAEAKK